MSGPRVSVISLNKDIRGLGVPSKIYSFFSAAKPVLYFGPKNSEIYNIIQEYDNGWFFENNEEEKLLNFFNNFNDIIEINKKSNISHYLSLNQYSEKKIIKKYNNLFAQYLKLTNNFN